MQLQKLRIRNWRDKKRALGLCTSCGNFPVYELIRNGHTKVYSKCKKCLISNAYYQSEYKEKMKNACNSRSK